METQPCAFCLCWSGCRSPLHHHLSGVYPVPSKPVGWFWWIWDATSPRTEPGFSLVMPNGAWIILLKAPLNNLKIWASPSTRQSKQNPILFSWHTGFSAPKSLSFSKPQLSIIRMTNLLVVWRLSSRHHLSLVWSALMERSTSQTALFLICPSNSLWFLRANPP